MYTLLRCCIRASLVFDRSYLSLLLTSRRTASFGDKMNDPGVFIEAISELLPRFFLRVCLRVVFELWCFTGTWILQILDPGDKAF